MLELDASEVLASEIDKWVKWRTSEDGKRFTLPKRKFTVRLPAMHSAMMAAMAQAMNLSKTEVAEQLLELAIVQAHAALPKEQQLPGA